MEPIGCRFRYGLSAALAAQYSVAYYACRRTVKNPRSLEAFRQKGTEEES